MCGLVGYVGNELPDPVLLRRAAEAAGARGPHSHGWVWRTPIGWASERGDGPLTADVPDRALRSHVVLAHSRLATSGIRPGDQPPASEAQPLVAGTLALAHNGTVPDARPELAVDSLELLVTIGSHFQGNDLDPAQLTDVARQAIERLCPEPTALLLASTAHRGIIVARSPGRHRPAQPLYRVTDAERGTYFCSVPIMPTILLHNIEIPEGVHDVQAH